MRQRRGLGLGLLVDAKLPTLICFQRWIQAFDFCYVDKFPTIIILIANKEDDSAFDLMDPGNWRKIDQKLRDYLVEKGPLPPPSEDYIFPKNESGRHFSHRNYKRIMKNGDMQQRRWLVYSTTFDKIYCFCCKLFTRYKETTQLASIGFLD